MFVYEKQKQESKDAVQKRKIEKPVAKPNLTGIPDAMKTRFENMSGFSFDDVRVNYNSGKPTQLQALVHTYGNQVYVEPSQERHLGDEHGHVVQQKRGVVRPVGHIGVKAINDVGGLEQESHNMSLNLVELGGCRGEANVLQRMKFKHATPEQTNDQGINARIAQIYPSLSEMKRSKLANDLDKAEVDQYVSQKFYCKLSSSVSIEIGMSNHITLGEYTVFYTGKGGKRNIHAIGKHKGSLMYEILAFDTEESPFCGLLRNWNKVKATMPPAFQTAKQFEVGMTVGFNA